VDSIGEGPIRFFTLPRRRKETFRVRLAVATCASGLLSCSLLTGFDVPLGVAPPGADAQGDVAPHAADGESDVLTDRASTALVTTSFENDEVFCGFEIGLGTAERFAEGRTGTYACKICGSGGGNLGRIRMYVNLPPASGRYAARVWIRRPTLDAAARPSSWDVRLMASFDGGEHAPTPASGVPDGTWRPADMTDTVQANPFRLRLRFGSEQVDLTPDDCLLVDDLEVFKLP
jgi:hypothetical protein